MTLELISQVTLKVGNRANLAFGQWSQTAFLTWETSIKKLLCHA